MYSDKLLARFLEPANIGDVEDADAVGVEGNITCGDVVHLSVKVQDGLIGAARFRAQGCATAIAAADVCCELVLGWTITAAQTLGLAEISAALGGIPEERENCAAIGLGALRSALERIKSGAPAAEGASTSA
jgi:NifU-like protein involved in Fe-S cluster formation